MLKQNKIFDLDKERALNQPNNEKFNEPKNCRYAMYFVIPLLVAFILLCILVNVDFTGEAYNHLKMDNQQEKFSSNQLAATNLDLNSEEKVTNRNFQNFLKSTGEMEKEKEWKAEISPMTFNEFVTTNHEVLLTESDSSLKKYKENVASMEVKRNFLPKLSLNKNQNTRNESNGTSKSNHRPLSVEAVTSRELLMAQQEPTRESREFYTNRIAGPANCIPTKTNCSLYCSNGGVSYIDESLDALKYSCPNTDLSLLVQNCEFTYGILANTFFWGFFTLKYLEISDSNLQTIQSNAFKESNVKNLQTLILRNNLITTLTATTFAGASSLKYFEFVQQPLQSTFTAEQFLQPLASNLSEAFITQIMEGGVVLNPRIWLQGAELSSLVYLNMANNNFQDILNGTTFRTLLAVENLILSNCSLLTVPATTFDVILSTLKYLDLRWNYLQTLDLQFLTNVVSHQIQLDLGANQWYCDCENKEMIEFLQVNIQLIETVVWYAPEKWQNVKMKDVLNDCEDSTTTSSTITITTTTADATTEIKDDSTISTELSTIFGTTEIDDKTSNTTSPTELTTTSEYSSSTISTSTTNKISSETTTLPTNSIYVVCYDGNNKETIYWFQRSHNFFIQTTSATSVTIQITQTLESFDIIYFTNYNDYKNLTENIHSNGNNTIVSIKGLSSLVTYIFCLTTTNHAILSPFDCQAHFVASLKVSWLLREDKIWFILVIVISCLLFLAASIFLTYVTLRKHPAICLINRHERILRANNTNQLVQIRSPKDIKSISTSYLTAQELKNFENDATVPEISLYSTKHTVPNGRAPILPPSNDNRKSSCPSYETSQHCALASKYLSVDFNRFNRNTHAHETSLYATKHTVPAERAPYVPTHRTTPSYIDLPKRTAASEVHFNRFEPLDNDADYQTIDHYEVVNF